MRVKFRCKRCGRDIDANFTRAGKMAQCAGCHFTQEIPDPNAQEDEKHGGGGGGGGPEPPQAPPQPPRKKKKKAGGGDVVQKLIVLAILGIAAFAAYKFGKGRFF